MFEYALIASNYTHRSVDAFRITLHPVQSPPRPMGRWDARLRLHDYRSVGYRL